MKTQSRMYGVKRARLEREIAGERRVLLADVRDLVDRASVLAKKMAANLEEVEAIETMRVYVIDCLESRPQRVSTSELARAFFRLSKTDLFGIYGGAT